MQEDCIYLYTKDWKQSHRNRNNEGSEAVGDNSSDKRKYRKDKITSRSEHIASVDNMTIRKFLGMKLLTMCSRSS